MKYQDISSLVIISVILITCMPEQFVISWGRKVDAFRYRGLKIIWIMV